MDSINRQQPEQNHADLSGAAALKQIRAVVDHAPTCFFCTVDAQGGSQGVRPMSVQKLDEGGIFWFLSASDSHKNLEITKDHSVRLYFQSSGHSGFLYLDGTATVSRDRAKIEELWEPILKTWFTGGIDDPRVTVIRFAPSLGYYWDTKHGQVVAGLKMLVGAALGRTMDDSIEGTLSV